MEHLEARYFVTEDRIIEVDPQPGAWQAGYEEGCAHGSRGGFFVGIFLMAVIAIFVEVIGRNL